MGRVQFSAGIWRYRFRHWAGLFGGYLWNTDTDLSLKLQAYLAIAIAIIGAAIWAIICYNRIVQNPQELVGNLNLNDTMYAIYTVFTASAQVVLGFVLSRIGFPRVGWGVLILGLVSGALFIAIGDHYPLLHYLIFLPMGVALSR
jgi:hypothetical protein